MCGHVGGTMLGHWTTRVTDLIFDIDKLQRWRSALVSLLAVRYPSTHSSDILPSGAESHAASRASCGVLHCAVWMYSYTGNRQTDTHCLFEQVTLDFSESPL